MAAKTASIKGPQRPSLVESLEVPGPCTPHACMCKACRTKSALPIAIAHECTAHIQQGAGRVDKLNPITIITHVPYQPWVGGETAFATPTFPEEPCPPRAPRSARTSLHGDNALWHLRCQVFLISRPGGGGQATAGRRSMSLLNEGPRKAESP